MELKPAHFRKDLGDLTELRESIQRKGLKRPLLVTPEGFVLSGTRRLKACEELGITDLPVRVVDNLPDAAIIMVSDPPGKPMLPSEMVALAEALEELDAPAKHRYRSEVSKAKHGVVAKPKQRGAPNDFIAPVLGMSTSTFYRIRRVGRAANEPGPHRSLARECIAELDNGAAPGGVYNKFLHGKAGRIKRERPIDIASDHYQKQAKKAADQTWRTLHHLESSARGMRELDAAMVLEGSTDSEQMLATLSSAIHNLGVFQKRLKKGKNEADN